MAQAITGVTNLGGFVKYRSPGAVLAEQQAKYAKPAEETPVTSQLAGYINKCWQFAQQAKQPIEQQMLRNMRMDNGIYEADKLASIRQMGGSEVYVLLTATKCRAAEAWINDVLRPVGNRPPLLKPTPVASLNPDYQQSLQEETMQVFQEVIAQAQALGEAMNMGILKEEIRQYAENRYDEYLLKVQEEAQERADRMSDLIADQFEEGGLHDAWWQVVSDFVRLKAGIVKGPVMRYREVESWVKGPDGNWTISTERKIVPTYERVSPLDLYPAPDSRGVDDGYIIERIPLDRKNLWEMIGVDGYSEENIRSVIRNYGIGGKREQLPIDSSRAMMDFGSTQSLYNSDKMDGLEFWGSVPGSLLTDWGMKGAIDPEMEYEINAIMVGHYVIRAVLNPDKLGRKPYSVDSYQRVPGSFWGKGVPELMADVQDVCNSVARAIVNNTMLASGPLVEVNVDRCPDFDELYPWKIAQSTNQQMSDAPAVRFYQPQIITGPLLQVFEFFSTMSEDQTGIPRWAYGNTNIGGAGATSSGLANLMGAASRNIKEAISHLERMKGGAVKRTYNFNMMYSPDQNIKGDATIVTDGAQSHLMKEQKTIRLNETLATTNNPVDLQIMGIDGRAKILKSIFNELAPEMDVIPDDNKLKALIAQIEQQQAQAFAAQGGDSPMGGSQPGSGMVPGKAPLMLDNSGSPMGGMDTNDTNRGRAIGA